MYWFRNDYSEGAHEKVLDALIRTNSETTPGYGRDEYCERARALLRGQMTRPDADIHFISGGTQTNLLLIASALRPWEAVVAAETGHVNVHETGAIEATGHKVLAAPAPDGKLTPSLIRDVLSRHGGEHMVKPRLVYISDTTELGTTYALDELEALSAFCREKNLLLYLDGARLASALAETGANVRLSDFARLTDSFTIGGTKCGALFGEALVLLNDALKKEFLYSVKQRGAMLAKGRLMGVQFEALFENGLYEEIGRHENEMARLLRKGLEKLGVTFLTDSHSNQIFPILEKCVADKLQSVCAFETERDLGERVCVRFVTGWATKKESVMGLLRCTEALLRA